MSRVTLCAAAAAAGIVPMASPAMAAQTALAHTANSTAAPAPAGKVAGAPCEKRAKACVSISRQKAWLTDGNGEVIYGPVPITTGAKGQETPTGTFSVMWKDKDHKSGQYDGAPMNNSVFFAPGDAFHEGSLNRQSAGCVHLSHAASENFFDYLQDYDEVQVLP
jgi:hypothetical protein